MNKTIYTQLLDVNNNTTRYFIIDLVVGNGAYTLISGIQSVTKEENSCCTVVEYDPFLSIGYEVLGRKNKKKIDSVISYVQNNGRKLANYFISSTFTQKEKSELIRTNFRQAFKCAGLDV